MHLVKRLGSLSLILAAVVLLSCPSQTTISKLMRTGAIPEQRGALLAPCATATGAGKCAYEIDDGTGTTVGGNAARSAVTRRARWCERSRLHRLQFRWS